MNEKWIGWKIHHKICWLKAKTWNSYLVENGSEYEKGKSSKKCVIKKIEVESFKNCLEATQLDNKISYLQKNEINVDSPKEDHNEFIKNKLKLQTLQRFKSEMHNVFTEEINKIALSSNDDKRMQSIDSIETYA